MIEVENLGKTYVDEPVVDDLSFFVPEGQVLGFLGPNGAGKTTVMRMITAFLPPTTGRVVVAGVDLDQDPVGLRRNVGYLPENVPLYPEMRVDEYLRFRADVEEVPRAEIRRPDRRRRRPMPARRCPAPGDRHPVQGLRQRVGLAGALIHQPPVLILDEPTVGLDPNQIIKVRELITELGRDHTVLLVDPHPARGRTGLRAGLHHRPRPHRRRWHAGCAADQARRQPVAGGRAQGRQRLGTRPRSRHCRVWSRSSDRGEGRYLLEHAAGVGSA